MKGREFKRVWGFPWDFAYLLQIEQRKLREMAAYFKKHKRTVGWEFQVRDCELCAKLIDIILERDAYYMSWLNANYGKKACVIRATQNPDYDIPFPKHVNIRNSQRFLPNVDFNENPKLIEHLKVSLRQTKALYVYNKIRSYRMFHWWD